MEKNTLRPGAAYAFGLRHRDGKLKRVPFMPKSPFSPRSKHLWGYCDTKTKHKIVPEIPRVIDEEEAIRKHEERKQRTSFVSTSLSAIDISASLSSLRSSASPRERRIKRKTSVHNSFHPHTTEAIARSGEQMPPVQAMVWLVERSLDDFRKQGRYRPFPNEVKENLPTLLKNLTHVKGELGYDEFKTFAQLTLNSNGGKIVPKEHELKECFERIDADGGGTLDKDEIFHALTIDWELIKFLRKSETLKPLLSLRNWRKAMAEMKEPDRRLEASCNMVELTANSINAQIVSESGAMPIFVALLNPNFGAVSVNVAGVVANLIWHDKQLQKTMPFDFPNKEYFEKDRESGFIPMLLSENLSDNAKATVLTALHNFCWKNEDNKLDLVERHLTHIEEELLRLQSKGASLRSRRCAAALLTMLMAHS
jgi:hypothetical protein